jgi:hypothetical protein
VLVGTAAGSVEALTTRSSAVAALPVTVVAW